MRVTINIKSTTTEPLIKCQADFFAPSKLILQRLIEDKCSKTMAMLFALLHPSIYQNNHSQVLYIKSVQITILNIFFISSGFA